MKSGFWQEIWPETYLVVTFFYLNFLPLMLFTSQPLTYLENEWLFKTIVDNYDIVNKEELEDIGLSINKG